jgi:hypothetical protein
MLHLNVGWGKLATGNAENSKKSVHNDRERDAIDLRAQDQAVQKLSKAVHVKGWKRLVKA